MSGIYIPSMEMPKSCYACIFFAQTDYWNKEDEADILSRCKRTGEKTWESVNGYLPNCPLIPVPEHGRLIDAYALMERFSYSPGDTAEDRIWIRAARRIIIEAPTVIPASEEDE